MKRGHCVLLGMVVAIAWLLCGCGSKVTSPASGQLKDNVYTNRFFAFQVKVPQTWTVLKKPSSRQLRKGMEVVTGGDVTLAAASVKSAGKVYCLLLARNVVSGMAIAVTAEEIDKKSEIRTGKDYLEEGLKIITGLGRPLQAINEIRPVQLLGREFHRVDLAGDILDLEQQQALFVRIENGHALLFVLTAGTAKALEETLAMVGLTPGGGKVVRPVDPAWVKGIKLQGIGGTAGRRLAIVNGRTLGPGDGAQVKAGTNTVLIRCIAVGDISAKVTIEDLEGERELRLN
jgi:hypothetical protein